MKLLSRIVVSAGYLMLFVVVIDSLVLLEEFVEKYTPLAIFIAVTTLLVIVEVPFLILMIAAIIVGAFVAGIWGAVISTAILICIVALYSRIMTALVNIHLEKRHKAQREAEQKEKEIS